MERSERKQRAQLSKDVAQRIGWHDRATLIQYLFSRYIILRPMRHSSEELVRIAVLSNAILCMDVYDSCVLSHRDVFQKTVANINTLLWLRLYIMDNIEEQLRIRLALTTREIMMSCILKEIMLRGMLSHIL